MEDEEEEERQSESEESPSGRGLKRSDISEEGENAKKTRLDENDSHPHTNTSTILPDYPPISNTEHYASSNTSEGMVDQHENLDPIQYEDPARPLPPDIMISVGLDPPQPQQPLANAFPCQPFIALIGCTRIGRSVSPLSSEEGDELLPQSYLLVQQVIPVVAENGTTT